MAEKIEFINYTLRFPEEYRKRLELEAQAHGRSLNQQIIRVLEMYFAGAGYPSNHIYAVGQMFELQSALAHDTPAETAWEFALENSKTGKGEGHYLIGLDRTFIRDLKISDKRQAAKEVGLALLTLHAKKGRDIRNLCWSQNSVFKEKRVIFGSEIPENIDTLPDFLEFISKGQWQDHLLVPDEEMDAIKQLLLVAKIENSPIINHMTGPDGMWLEVGCQKFTGANRNVYTQALAKMGVMGLVELQPRTEADTNKYVLAPEGVQYLMRIAAFAT